MAVILEHLVRGSDNQIKLQLTEDGAAISGAWNGLDIQIGSVMISRTVAGNGVDLSTSTGVLTLTPGDLTPTEQTALDALMEGSRQRVKVVVTSALNDDGVVFGDGGTTIVFAISDKPA